MTPSTPIAGGSFDFLATGYVFLGHGIIPKMKEYDASGKCIYTAQFGLDNEVTSYRAPSRSLAGRSTNLSNFSQSL